MNAVKKQGNIGFLFQCTVILTGTKECPGLKLFTFQFSFPCVNTHTVPFSAIEEVQNGPSLSSDCLVYSMHDD